ncbi:hypothetical protein K443DRAFT_132598 [Laccaria amethystina LaAM-08-1]|uniref:Uncharacterized protein n=1 Tax=Laccaria amethystina LaAM-08-1 TaxID=1095629 RepID=A0A0C9XGE1_9AGAR|nr:hypothetical protein K443DRAFT_132598 [Laccaria amethystina LaAM-08-1]
MAWLDRGLGCLSVSAANDDLERTLPNRIQRLAPSSLRPLNAGTELGVVERAIHCAAAITGRLRIEPEPLTEHRRDVNIRLEWKANPHGSKAPCRRLRKSIPLDR